VCVCVCALLWRRGRGREGMEGAGISSSSDRGQITVPSYRTEYLGTVPEVPTWQ